MYLGLHLLTPCHHGGVSADPACPMSAEPRPHGDNFIRFSHAYRRSELTGIVAGEACYEFHYRWRMKVFQDGNFVLGTLKIEEFNLIE